MAEDKAETRYTDLAKFLDPKKFSVELRSAETPDEVRSRVKLAELEAEHKLRTQEADDTHKRRTQWWLHIFVMTVVAVAFLASTYIAIFKDASTGLPDKAMGIITAIVAGGVGYITGKSSK
jgi:Ca2+/H+ antiporter